MSRPAYSYGVLAGSGGRMVENPARGPRQHVALLSLGACVLAAVAACSGNAATYTTDADRGSTHALVTVERRDEVGAEAPSQNRAFATFVRTPPEADPAQVMRVAGLDFELPELGECRVHGRDSNVTVSPLRRVELLDAGDVTLETAEGRVYRYAKALPTQSLCLNCHGPRDQLKPEVRAAIDEHYPNDRAVGYKEGEIRGAIIATKRL